MTAAKNENERKYFTVKQANATLPLLRSILRDVTELAQELRDRHERLQRLQDNKDTKQAAEHREEMDGIEAEFDRGRERMQDYLSELDRLGIELKDPFTGLVDFRCMMDGREVYLCWRLGERAVEHWHELDAGFAGRQPLREKAASK